MLQKEGFNMALTVGINSYISVADADAYFADRLNNAVWVTSTKKAEALIQATQIIDNRKFRGLRAATSQNLAFPRFGVYFEGVLLDSNTVPKAVITATCELAIWVLQSDMTAPDDLAGFGSVQLGPIKIETKSTTKSLPPIVSGLLRPFTDTSITLMKG
jgi:hypothetical protein